MSIKLHNSEQFESIFIMLDPNKQPIAWKNRIESLMNSGMTSQEAEAFCYKTPIEMEFYYDKSAGLYMVETEAVEAGTIYNPYDGVLMEDMDEEE